MYDIINVISSIKVVLFIRSNWEELYEELIKKLSEELSEEIKKDAVFELIFMTYSYVHKMINKVHLNDIHTLLTYLRTFVYA